jgi:hypothetical protein
LQGSKSQEQTGQTPTQSMNVSLSSLIPGGNISKKLGRKIDRKDKKDSTFQVYSEIEGMKIRTA